MSELSSLVSEYLVFRAARGFQPSRKLERLLNQFADALPPGRLDGRLFTQAQALAWAHSPAGGGAGVAGLSGCPRCGSSRSISPVPGCRPACREPGKVPAVLGGPPRICSRTRTSKP